MSFAKKIKINEPPLGVKGKAKLPACPYEQVGVGREAIRLLVLPVFLRLAFGFCLSSIAVGTQDFVDCVHYVGEGCCIVSFF
jgi:hypothetical protein